MQPPLAIDFHLARRPAIGAGPIPRRLDGEIIAGKADAFGGLGRRGGEPRQKADGEKEELHGIISSGEGRRWIA